jgi:CheY-like chemotaxis protein
MLGEAAPAKTRSVHTPMKADELLPSFMVVDDNEDDVFLLAKLLKKAGLKNPLLHFRNGGDAFMFLKQFCPPERTQIQLPALMLLDINMPGLSGFDILVWAKQEPALENMKIIVLSGANEEWDAQIAKKLGADDYILKFPAPEEFASLVSTVLPITSPTP